MKRWCLPVLVALVAGLCLPAMAQDYPARQVTIIVPFAPGGSADIIARLYAQKLSERVGKPVVVENRAGAGTVVGASAAARAAPDGYTLLMGGSSALAYNPTLHKNLPYDPAKDFVPLAHVAAIPFVLVVQPSLPVRSVADLIKLAKEKPGHLAFGTAGTGSPAHLCAEYLRGVTGIDITYIPYKGSAPVTRMEAMCSSRVRQEQRSGQDRQREEHHEAFFVAGSRRPCRVHAGGADRAGPGLSRTANHFDRAVAGGRGRGCALPRGRSAPVGSIG